MLALAPDGGALNLSSCALHCRWPVNKAALCPAVAALGRLAAESSAGPRKRLFELQSPALLVCAHDEVVLWQTSALASVSPLVLAQAQGPSGFDRSFVDG